MGYPVSAKYRHAPIVGWRPSEILWLEAALTLPAYEFLLACEDISGMSGKTVSAITAKVKSMRRESDGAKHLRKSSIPLVPKPRSLRRITSEERMAGSAYCARRKPEVA